MRNYETIDDLNVSYYIDSSLKEDSSTFFQSSSLDCPIRTIFESKEDEILFSEKPDYNSSSSVKPSDALEFLRVIGKLKRLERTGWIHHKIRNPESVADHSYRLSMASLLITDPLIDKNRLVRLVLVHDLAESLVGDIVTVGPFKDKRYTIEDKKRMEHDAIKKITKNLKNKEISEEIYRLWKEFEDQITPESQLGKDLDKFDCMLQADEYEQLQGKNLQDFFETTKGVFLHPEVQQWDSYLRNERNERKKKE